MIRYLSFVLETTSATTNNWWVSMESFWMCYVRQLGIYTLLCYFGFSYVRIRKAYIVLVIHNSSSISYNTVIGESLLEDYSILKILKCQWFTLNLLFQEQLISRKLLRFWKAWNIKCGESIVFSGDFPWNLQWSCYWCCSSESAYKQEIWHEYILSVVFWFFRIYLSTIFLFDYLVQLG